MSSRQEHSNIEILDTLVDRIRPPGEQSSNRNTESNKETHTAPGRPYVEQSSSADCKKLRALGGEEKVGWDEGLNRTIEWYTAHGETWWGDIKRSLVA